VAQRSQKGKGAWIKNILQIHDKRVGVWLCSYTSSYLPKDELKKGNRKITEHNQKIPGQGDYAREIMKV
jgi:hypothetical protein